MSELRYWEKIEYLSGKCQCDNCYLHNKCRDNNLACSTYQRWVNSNVGSNMRVPINPEPDRDIYNEIFGVDK